MRQFLMLLVLPLIIFFLPGCDSETGAPYGEDGRIHFTYQAPEAKQVYLTGDFLNWNPRGIRMEQDDSGVWRAETKLLPVGFHEYKFVVDGNWMPDPNNPISAINNYGEPNSIFYVNELGEVELRAPDDVVARQLAQQPGGEGMLYVSLVWHQHQPYYLDASRDQLVGPWVRTHTTKDYYDMTAMLRNHPDIHVAMNFTPVLVEQIERYVDMLGEFYDEQSGLIDGEGFLRKYRNRTDPWIDLMFVPTDQFNWYQDSLLFKGEWNAFSVSRVIMERWPEYMRLKEMDPEDFTVQDKRNLKCLFYLANFDPEFLEKDYDLIVDETGRTAPFTLHDLLKLPAAPPYEIDHPFTEQDASRLVGAFYKIASSINPLNRYMDYRNEDGRRQVEFITTPYFHPILPLIANVHAGKTPDDSAPDSITFAYPEDAKWQVSEAADHYSKLYGHPPTGMWPAEGSVSEQVVDMFVDNGVEWIATGDGVLSRSTPEGLEATTPYRVQGENGRRIAVFFRDTHLSDLVGFRYQRWDPEEAAQDMINQVLSRAPESEGDTAHVTILLDGENAWEWYEQDPDAKTFLTAFYRELGRLQRDGRLMTVTPSEYLEGNPERGVPPHPLQSLPVVKQMWPGSWIRGDFSTWIGEDEENRAWAWLAKVREDLAYWETQEPGRPGMRMPQFQDRVRRAKRAMYAAEGSDWFWWYGDDQNTGVGDSMWDRLYRAHLMEVYNNLRSAGFHIEVPQIPELLNESSKQASGDSGGAMQVGGGNGE